MDSNTMTQLGVAGVICYIVIEKCFGLIKYVLNKKACNDGQRCEPTQQEPMVTEKFCDERTARIEASINSTQVILTGKIDNLHTTIEAGFKKLNGDG